MQSTSESVTEVKQNVQDLDEQVQEVNNMITEIPNEYVKNSTFENYKVEINQKFGGIYTVKGSIEDYQSLLNLEGMKVGDVYNLLDTGANYVYAEEGWDKLSETIDLSIYLKSTDADNTYAKITDLNDLIARVEILENGGTE